MSRKHGVGVVFFPLVAASCMAAIQTSTATPDTSPPPQMEITVTREPIYTATDIPIWTRTKGNYGSRRFLVQWLHGIAVTNLDGTDPRIIFPTGNDIQYSDDGGAIYFLDDWEFDTIKNNEGDTVINNHFANLYRYDTEKQQLKILFTKVNRYGISPDGQEIVLSSFQDGGINHIYIMTEEGTNIRQMTNGKYGELEPAWSPDGGFIAYSRQTTFLFVVGERKELVVMSADGKEIEVLTDDISAIRGYFPLWYPDGQRLIYLSRKKDPDPAYCDWWLCKEGIYFKYLDMSSGGELVDTQYPIWHTAIDPANDDVYYSQLLDVNGDTSIMNIMKIGEGQKMPEIMIRGEEYPEYTFWWFDFITGEPPKMVFAP
jgi:dipeptidyl aminopeptidase/acylaminoacyl peptidase